MQKGKKDFLQRVYFVFYQFFTKTLVGLALCTIATAPSQKYFAALGVLATPIVVSLTFTMGGLMLYKTKEFTAYAVKHELNFQD